MTITLSPDQALSIISWAALERADEAQRVLDACNAQRAINEDPAATMTAKSSQTRVNTQDAEALASLAQNILLITGKKVEMRG